MMARTAANVIGSTISLTAASATNTMMARHHEPDEAPRPHPEPGNPREKRRDVTRTLSAVGCPVLVSTRGGFGSHVTGTGHATRPPVSCPIRRDPEPEFPWRSSRVFGAVERVAKSELASGRRERRTGTGGQCPRFAAADDRADPPGVLREDRSGTRPDQDADRGAGEPGHQRKGDTEEAELGFVAPSPPRASRSWPMLRTRPSRCW